MANYSELDGYVFDEQSNVGWGLTLKMAGKAPAVAKRIFDTYEHALAYVNDVSDSAIEGLVLSVVADTDALNGVYFVQQAAAKAVEADEEKGIEAVDAKEAILVKLGSEEYTNTEIENNTKTYSIVKATEAEVGTLGANVKEAYKLVDVEDKQVGEYIPVYKDSALQKVELVEQELQFTYLLTDGNTSTVGVDVSKFLAESEFKDGLEFNENGEVFVKVDAASEAFLTVGADGVKLDGVQDAIDAEKTRAEGAESALSSRLAVIEGDGAGSIKKAVADAKTAETTARNQAIASTKSELEGKIDKKSEIVDVTNLFKSSGETLEGYTMQQLANSHLVYKYTDSSSLGGASSVQVTMVAGSPSNSAMVIDGTTTIPTFGSYCTLIFEIYSEQNGKYILTQYLARVKLSDDISSNNKWITESVEQHILATQESIDTLSTKVDTEQTRAKAAEKANAAAIANEKTRAEAAESGLTAAIANEISAREAAITAETSAREAEIARTKTELEEKINNKSEIVDVTNLFKSSGETLSGYTMQQLANSHLVYKDSTLGSFGGSPYVQVTMVAGSPGNSPVVIDDTTQMPNFGSNGTLIFEMHSEGVLTQYVAYVGFNGSTCTTTQVNSYVLATQEGIDTLSTRVNTLGTEVNKKQDKISGIDDIISGAALGATSVQSINVTSLFANGGELSGCTLVDLTKNKLYHCDSNGNIVNTIKCVGYGNSAINPNANEANLVMESFEGAVREIAIAHIKANGTTLTTDSVKTYSSNVFVMRVSQVDYDTMKAAGTLDENTLYVIAEITE